ncbi:MAG TPA: thioredoxin family protein [Kiritimatiellia bacterium]|nr:thioredoxin family protein [Kiritimatiellia bacterium]
MKTKVLLPILIAALALGAAHAWAQAAVGAPAPGFTLTDTKGAAHALADFAGKPVVLEWTNPDCPFVKKHYGAKNMQALQAKYVAQGVVWLSVCSSAPGKQGHYPADEWNRILAEQGSAATALLLDPDGQVGLAYGAKTTPHLFVVDAAGNLVYDGAIDDRPSTDPADIPGARSYVSEALDAVLAGAPVPVAQTKPYGCSVKY